MTKYWLKIGLGAFLIFVVGFGMLSAVRKVKGSVHSGRDLTIPLGAFGAYLPFKLEGTKVGTLRSLTIRRDAPKSITGFVVRARLSDTSGTGRLRDCQISLSDPTDIDERTTFTCLQADSGFVPFGEVRIEIRAPELADGMIVQPLLLPAHVVRDIRADVADTAGRSLADSLARDLSGQVRTQARVISDSIRAAALEERARAMQKRADSIRANSPRPVTPPTP